MAIDLGKATFRGYKRENGRVGVRNHVIILPVDDLSNAAAEGVAQQHQGHDGDPAPVRPAAVRRRPRAALPHADRHRLQPQRRRGGGDRHRGRLDEEGRRRHRDHRQAGRRLRHRAATATTTRSCARRRRRRSSCSGRASCIASERAAEGPVGLDQVRRVGHDLRLRREPDRRQRVRQALPARHDARLRRDDRADRRRAPGRAALPRRRRCARSSCSCSTATRR